MDSPARRAWLALPFLAALYIWGINWLGVISTDEPRYAEIGYEMAQDHQWVTPRLWGEPWFEKPALLYWMIAAAYRLGFTDDWAPRLPVALLSIGFLLFYQRQLAREFGEAAATWAAGLLATCVFWLAYGQLAVTDLPLAVFFSAALLLALAWLRTGGRRELAWAGVCLGLAVLAKGLVPLVLALPVVWVGRKRWKELLLPTGVSLLVALPWYAWCTAENGMVFLTEFIVKHHFQRFSSTAIQHEQPVWYYVPVIVGLLFPWTPLLAAVPVRQAAADSRTSLLLAVVVFGFVFFSLSTNKLPGYLLPLLPALFALVGMELARRPRRALTAVCLGLLGLLPIALRVLPLALQSGIRQVQDVPFSVIEMGWLAGAAGVGFLCYFRQAAPGTVLAIAAIALVAFKLLAFQELDRTVAVRQAFRRDPAVCLTDPPQRRAVLYGLQFYKHAELMPCRAK